MDEIPQDLLCVGCNHLAHDAYYLPCCLMPVCDHCHHRTNWTWESPRAFGSKHCRLCGSNIIEGVLFEDVVMEPLPYESLRARVREYLSTSGLSEEYQAQLADINRGSLFSSLPSEVICNIFGNLDKDPKDLVSLMMVSRRVNAIFKRYQNGILTQHLRQHYRPKLLVAWFEPCSSPRRWVCEDIVTLDELETAMYTMVQQFNYGCVFMLFCEDEFINVNKPRHSSNPQRTCLAKAMFLVSQASANRQKDNQARYEMLTQRQLPVLAVAVALMLRDVCFRLTVNTFDDYIVDPTDVDWEPFIRMVIECAFLMGPEVLVDMDRWEDHYEHEVAFKETFIESNSGGDADVRLALDRAFMGDETSIAVQTSMSKMEEHDPEAFEVYKALTDIGFGDHRGCAKKKEWAARVPDEEALYELLRNGRA